MDDDEPPSRSEIWQIMFDVRDGEANPEDPKRLMQHFCDVVRRKERPAPELLQYFRQAFEAYLSGAKGIEAALGLRRKTGKPKADPETRTDMAMVILILRIKGMAFQDAQAEVVEKFGWGKTIVGEAWRHYKRDAMDLLRLSRSAEHEGFTPDEMRNIRKIFAKEPWMIPGSAPSSSG